MDIKKLYLKYSFPERSIYLLPKINEKKANNAIALYSKKKFGNFELSVEDIAMQIDDTVFGSAKEGLIITKYGLFCHEKFEEPVFVPIEECKNIVIEGTKILISGMPVYELIVQDKRYFPVLQNVMNIICAFYNGNSSPSLEQQELPSEASHRDDSSKDNSGTGDSQTEDEKMAKLILSENKYFYYGLHKNIMKLHKFNAASNTIDVVIDQLFAVSQEQYSNAFRRNPSLENRIEKEFASAVYNVLSMALNFPKIVFKNSNKSKALTALAQNDLVLNELIIVILLRSSDLVREKVKDQQAAAIAGQILGQVFIQRLMLPFCKWKLEAMKNMPGLERLNANVDAESLCMSLLKSRQRIHPDDERPFDDYVAAYLIKNSMSGNAWSIGDIIDGYLEQSKRVPFYAEIMKKNEANFSQSLNEYGSFIEENLESFLVKILS